MPFWLQGENRALKIHLEEQTAKQSARCPVLVFIAFCPYVSTESVCFGYLKCFLDVTSIVNVLCQGLVSTLCHVQGQHDLTDHPECVCDRRNDTWTWPWGQQIPASLAGQSWRSVPKFWQLSRLHSFFAATRLQNQSVEAQSCNFFFM